MHRDRPRHRVALAASLGLACGPLDAPSAYEGVPDLCAEEAQDEWLDRIEACREDASCEGWVSFRGEVGGVRVAVAEPILVASVDHLVLVEGTIERDNIAFAGFSPYFEFAFKVQDVGGPIGPSFEPRTLEVAAGQDDDPTTARSTFRVSNQVQSVDQAANGGSVSVVLQTDTEAAGSFDLQFGSGDAIVGCFHSFPSEVSVEQEAAP